MEQQLKVYIGNGPAWEIQAETQLGPFPQLTAPEAINGELLGLTTEELLKLKFSNGVKVDFDNGMYKFSRLEKDGTFTLSKDWSGID